jgi:Tfp pilus assembly protein PilZ
LNPVERRLGIVDGQRGQNLFLVLASRIRLVQDIDVGVELLEFSDRLPVKGHLIEIRPVGES